MGAPSLGIKEPCFLILSNCLRFFQYRVIYAGSIKEGGRRFKENDPAENLTAIIWGKKGFGPWSNVLRWV
jgi:hypothetical protein